jgi:hypothetical protein
MSNQDFAQYPPGLLTLASNDHVYAALLQGFMGQYRRVWTSQNDRDVSPIFYDPGISPGPFYLSGVCGDSDKLGFVFTNYACQRIVFNITVVDKDLVTPCFRYGSQVSYPQLRGRSGRNRKRRPRHDQQNT